MRCHFYETEKLLLRFSLLSLGCEMETSTAINDGVDACYQPLPPLYFAFVVIWVFSAVSWTFNTCRNRHFQPNKLQWMLASVPWIKALQLSLSFLFWYSCFYSNVCSLWISFGVYILGVLFQTSAFVSFVLISHGYCITCHRLSLSERRTMAVLGCVFYLTLVGYRASVPYFSLSFIEDEDVEAMHDAVYTKYTMFKKFQGAMHIVAVSELAIFINMGNSIEDYWIWLLIRELAQFFIFMYIGWIFRSQELAPRFSVMPVLRSKGETSIPPIYSIAMDAETFKEFRRHEWHIGVPEIFLVELLMFWLIFMKSLILQKCTHEFVADITAQGKLNGFSSSRNSATTCV